MITVILTILFIGVIVSVPIIVLPRERLQNVTDLSFKDAYIQCPVTSCGCMNPIPRHKIDRYIRWTKNADLKSAMENGYEPIDVLSKRTCFNCGALLIVAIQEHEYYKEVEPKITKEEEKRNNAKKDAFRYNEFLKKTGV